MASPLLLFLCLLAAFPVAVLCARPFNVSYDHRAILIDGQRRLLISAGIHYPRATPQMWPGLLKKAKDGGANVIQTYVFWSGHEPVKGKYRFSGRYNLAKFVKLVDEAGLMLHLRIGPYACAEWNFGGFPVWLRDIPGIVFRTNNTRFQEEMSVFVQKVVNLMKENRLFSWQGGPIILAQIENEYGNIEHSFGEGGKQYVQWAAALAQNLEIGIPWVMCRQNDAPSNIISTCNDFYCDGFIPNGNGKPVLWTEDWNGWYSSWGDPIPWRPIEDNAFAVARFFQRGGSFHNYYMYFGGTNFEHTSGGPFVTTSYDYDAPIDEYGLLRQPKWGHFRELHTALKLCEEALFTGNEDPLYMRLGPKQEAYVYGDFRKGQTVDDVLEGASVCAAFLANIDTSSAIMVQFNGKTFELPPWSVSILPDCKNVAFNTAKVSAQTSLIRMEKVSQLHNILRPIQWKEHGGFQNDDLSWEFYSEPIGMWSSRGFTTTTLLEHLNLTKDSTDYLWYICRLEVSANDIAILNESRKQAVLSIDAMRDAVSIFVNAKFSAFATASTSETWVRVEQVVTLEAGWNEIALLSSTVGLQNYGAFLERDGAGLQGEVVITGLASHNLSLTNTEWTYEVGLKGEHLKIYSEEGQKKVLWSSSAPPLTKSPMTWYKTVFDAPFGDGPVALDLGSMGKGEIWLNGRSLGRYWPAFHANMKGCSDRCDYRGTYSSTKCLTGCGQPTQRWYHVPRSWLKLKDNLLVLLEEIGGDVSQVSLMLRYQGAICAHISEYESSISSWLHRTGANSGKLSSKVTPRLEISCEEGYHIHMFSFASFGNPYGQCGNFQQGHCHSRSSKPLVEAACIGRQHCSLDVTLENFGEDPCPGTEKSLAVEAVCTHQLWHAKGTTELSKDEDLPLETQWLSSVK